MLSAGPAASVDSFEDVLLIKIIEQAADQLANGSVGRGVHHVAHETVRVAQIQRRCCKRRGAVGAGLLDVWFQEKSDPYAARRQPQIAIRGAGCQRRVFCGFCCIRRQPGAAGEGD